MTLTTQQVAELLTMIRHTQEVEMTCPECLDELDKYTQCILDGAPIAGILHRVQEHLDACPCCDDQFQLVLETLRGLDD